MLAGGRSRGTMYACYGFLEDHLGCRWLIPGVDLIPRRDPLKIKPINETVKPAFEYRHVYYIGTRNALWNARNRLNDMKGAIPPEMGGMVSYSPFVHSFYHFVPPAKYFKRHPEYFSEIDGKRISVRAQLCLSNPEVVDLVTHRVCERLRKYPGIKIVSVSQMDWGKWCRCEKCARLDEREGTLAGSIINFVNRVAERVEKEFPDAAIDTLAYQYSLKAPKSIRPRRNVIVRVCFNGCWSHPLKDGCSSNKHFAEILRDWARLTDRIYVWNYEVNFGQLWVPHPNLRVIGPNLRFFRDGGVRGVFEESGGSTFARMANLGHVRAYVLAKHLWNPDYGVDRAVNEFLGGYYGPAGVHIKAYIDLIHEALRVSGSHLRLYENFSAPFLSDEHIKKAQGFFDQAEAAAAGDKELLTRVRIERMALDWLVAYRALKPFKVKAGRLVRDADKTLGFDKSMERFYDTLQAVGLERLGQKPFRHALLTKETTLNAGKSYEAVTLANPDIVLQIVPELGGRIWSIVDHKTRRELTLKLGPQNPRVLTMGGYSELLISPKYDVGRSTPFSVVPRRDAPESVSVTLSGEMTPGLVMQRTISVPKKGLPRFTVRSVLTNRGARPVASAFRTYPELAFGRTGPLEAYIKRRDGSWTRHEIKRRRTWFSEDKLPAGAWAFYTPSAKVGLLVRFRPDQVKRTLLYSRGVVNCRLECHSPEQALKPGQSISMEVSYEVIHAPPGEMK